MFHITYCLILEICRQKLNKKLPNIANIIVKILISKLSFRRLKLEIYLVIKDQCLSILRSFVVYRFTCLGCNASYIGETTRHLTMRIKEHLETSSKSHIFKHFGSNRNCKELCDTECFETIDSTISSYRLKFKEAVHITWEKPSLNKEVKHVSISITI